MKEYNIKWYTILFNILSTIFLGLFISVLLDIFNVNWNIIYIVLGIFILLSLYMIYSYIKTKIIVDNNMLIYLYKGKKKEFDINFYSIKAVSGDSGQELTLIDKDGKKEELDCDFLSSNQYNDLLNEIGVIGKKQGEIKMDKNIMFYYIAAVIIVGIGGTLLSKYFTNKNSNKFLQENPGASKLFTKNKSIGITSQTIEILKVDDNESSSVFVEGMKYGIYLKPGNRELTVRATSTRPGILHKRVTTVWGPMKINVNIEPDKTYELRFDKKEEQFSIHEI